MARRGLHGRVRRTSPEPRAQRAAVPGARETIAALANRGDLLLGVATGKSRRGVDILFERERLAPYFTTIQTADTHPSKPHPAMVHEAMAEAGVLALDAVVVGDTTFDVEMARLAGTGVVGVTWGYHPAQLSAAGAHALVDGYAELPGALDRLFRRLEAATARGSDGKGRGRLAAGQEPLRPPLPRRSTRPRQSRRAERPTPCG